MTDFRTRTKLAKAENLQEAAHAIQERRKFNLAGCIPTAPRAKPTTHSEPKRAGHDRARFACVLEKRNEAEPRPWLASPLATIVAVTVVVVLTLWAMDATWTALTLQPGVVWE